MTVAEKYLKVLEIREKKIYKAEDDCGFGRNTLKNAIDKNRKLSDEYHKIFINVFGVNEVWWKSEKGDVVSGKVTPVTEFDKKNTDREEISILIKNLSRIGDLNEYLLNRTKDLEEFIKKNGLLPPA